MLRFLVFRNVLIALCSLCMALETLYLYGFNLQVDALALFIFFATFFVYNFHAFANHLVSEPFKYTFHLLDKNVSFTQRICVITGFMGTIISFYFISTRVQMLCVILGLITLAYTLPFLKLNGKRVRLREISYVKIFTIAFVWSLITVALPVLNYNMPLSTSLFWIIFSERMLFVYSITIPFEIRDMEQEQRYGVRTIPAIYGIKKSKRLGYLLLVLFCVIALFHQIFIGGSYHGFQITVPLILSAIFAGMLIYFTNEKRNKWYYKGWIDGTMAIQFILLLLFN